MSAVATAPALTQLPSRARGNAMILVLVLSCFVFGCAYQYILGVPDQVAEIAGIDLSQVSLMMGVYGVCNAIGTPLLVMALTPRGPENAAACQSCAHGSGHGRVRRHAHLFDYPCRSRHHGRGQRIVRGHSLYRCQPHRRPRAQRFGHVERGARVQRVVRVRVAAARVRATSSRGSKRIGCW